MTWVVLAAALAGLGIWFLVRRTVEVPCTIDLENTNAHFHAHVDLQGVHVDEGDEVLVHGAPDRIAIDEVRVLDATATVKKASLPRRLWERVVGRTHITEMYEVGFEG
ncbi:MAG: hypothetical protein MUF21_07710 [Gemmatimonadaceae bacterium]|jgi:hypothetical protein|nr:hypothetical protein [Gemmatimonadaceae bacterium]